MQAFRRIPYKLPLLLLLIAAVAGLALARPAEQYLQHRAVLLLTKQIQTAPPEQLPAKLDQLLAFGPRGWRASAPLLASSRSELSLATAEAIDRALHTNSHLIYLLPELAPLADSLSPEALTASKRWSKQLLEQKSIAPTAESAATIAACETLLRQPSSTNDGRNSANRIAQISTLTTGSEFPQPLPISADSVSIPFPESVPLPSIAPPPPAAPRAPGKFIPAPSPVIQQEPRRFLPNRVPEIPKDSPDPPDDQLPPGQLSTQIQKVTSASIPLADATDFEVMQALWTEQAELANAELAKRGFLLSHRQLAKQITHPDPSMRLAALEQVPRYAGLRGRRWLHELTNDPDARVSTAARSILSAGSR